MLLYGRSVSRTELTLKSTSEVFASVFPVLMKTVFGAAVPLSIERTERRDGSVLCTYRITGEEAVTRIRHTFHIHAENEYFSRENGVVYRNGKVYRDIFDRASGQRLDSLLIRTNHARVMYDCPPSMIIKKK